nr:adhesion protein 1 [Theama mediterranea]
MKYLLALLIFTVIAAFARADSTEECVNDWSLDKCEKIKCGGFCNRPRNIPRCRKTCGFCNKKPPQTCFDRIPAKICHAWAKAGRCFLLPRRMEELCKKTCCMCNLEYRKCPPGWERIDDYCLKVVNKKLSFKDAFKYCYYRGSLLASVYSKAENDAIIERISSLKEPVWFGLHDLYKEGKFRFSDGTKFGRFEYWTSNHTPNDDKRDCGTYEAESPHYWRFRHCSNKFAFVCRRLPGDPCKHKCHANAICHHFGGGRFGCKCKPGYMGNGVTSCKKPCLCVASGDPHYKTYDGQWIHFMGRCTYSMSESVRAPKGCNFQVRVKNYDILAKIKTDWRKMEVSWTRYAELRIGGEVIRIGQKQVVHVNGEAREIPIQCAGGNGHISVVHAGAYVIAYSKRCGVMVGFDGRSTAFIKVNRDVFGGKLTGICGNCNENRLDDLTTKQGVDVSTKPNKYALIGNSYRVVVPEDKKLKKSCDDGNDFWPVCSDEELKEIKSDKYCGKFTDTGSPFKRCMENKGADYKGYSMACVYDVCAYLKKPEEAKKAVCAALATMAEECAENGYREDWRDYFGCPLSCGDNMKYKFSTSMCEKNCYNYRNMKPCGERKKEGCVCEEGYVRSGENCIKPEHCGCKDARGYYHEIGQSWIKHDCTANITCKDTATTSSEPMKCVTNAECGVKDGKRGCNCKKGFVGEGTDSCEDIDECKDDPCHAQAVCENTPGSFECKCKPGFEGDGKKCEDINECEKNKDICGDDNASCRNTFGSYKCECNDGYTKSSSDDKCEDKKECSTGNYKCPLNSHCVNTEGSYKCDCNEGYEKDGDECVDIDECDKQTDNCDDDNGICTNKPGSFVCSCKKGFKMVDGNKCEDIDECALDPKMYGLAAKCVNTPGSYKAVCNEGYRKKEDAADTDNCEDIDECEEKTATCHADAICKNNPGSYGCVCKKYYEGNGFSMCKPKEYCGTSEANCDPKATCKNKIGGFDCTCKEGYVGDGKTCKDEDECKTDKHNCDENANCHNTEGSFKCGCKNGYKGEGTKGTCQDIDECLSDSDNDCHKQATCKNTEGSYTCTCNEGFKGDGIKCENVNECKENTHKCDDKADCDDTVGSYRCTCRAGYKGDGKECVNIDECAERKDKCDHRNRATCTDTEGSYTCKCKENYVGDGYQCHSPHSVCKTLSSGKLECKCASGYWGNGTVCNDINECLDPKFHRCSKNALCHNTKGGYTCTCKEGYKGSGYQCEDVDECQKEDVCMAHAECKNKPGSYDCSCLPGFVRKDAKCEDKDECLLNEHNCDANAKCTNTLGSFTCSCNVGYEGSGRRHDCHDVDECTTKKSICDKNAKCVNTLGSYKCKCNEPFYSGDGFTCDDVDECTLNTDKCSPLATCTNTDGGYTCACRSGYQGDGKTCTDVHECSDGSHKCSRNGQCIEKEGSYDCKCNPGYVGDGKTCRDIDECQASPSPCHEHAVCINTEGSFRCKCKPEYEGDGITVCKQILVNECEDGSHKCDKNAQCIDLRRGYTCKCKQGYSGCGFNCENTNECLNESRPCHRDAQCTDLDPGYKCQCKEGFKGDGKTCKDINECTENLNRCHKFANCINKAGSYECACKKGYRGCGFSCHDIDECRENTYKCETGSICLNTIGSYKCECIPGYIESDGHCIKDESLFTQTYASDLAMSMVNDVNEIKEKGESFSAIHI